MLINFHKRNLGFTDSLCSLFWRYCSTDYFLMAGFSFDGKDLSSDVFIVWVITLACLWNSKTRYDHENLPRTWFLLRSILMLRLPTTSFAVYYLIAFSSLRFSLASLFFFFASFLSFYWIKTRSSEPVLLFFGSCFCWTSKTGWLFPVSPSAN